MNGADSVGDDELLYRRVPVGQSYFKVTPEGYRLSSQAFSDRYRRPSVDRASMLGHDPSRSQMDVTDAVVSLVAFQVRAVRVPENDPKGRLLRELEADVEAVPLEDNPAHAEIFLKPESNQNSAFRRLIERLALFAKVEVESSECTIASTPE